MFVLNAVHLLQLHGDGVNMECIKNKCKYYQDHLFNASCFECNLGSRTYKKEYVIDCIIDEKIGDLSDRIR